MANKIFGAIGTSGGSDGYLDNIDGTNLTDDDGVLLVSADDNFSGLYHLDVDSAAAQVVPTIMQPDANGGDKRWLLRGIKISALNLYEAGTTNLVSISQSSGNLTIDNTYDTGTITFKGENTGDATMLVMNPAGGVDMYYAGSKKIETETGGVTITGVSASTTSTSGTYDASTDFTVGSTVITDGVITDASGFQIAGGTITLTGSGETLATFTDDGSTDLYHNGVKTVFTDANGVSVTNGTSTLEMQYSADDFYYTNTDPAGLLYFRATNGASATKILMSGDPDGSVELYYAGTKAFGTTAFGSEVCDTSGDTAILDFVGSTSTHLGRIYGDSQNIYIQPGSNENGIRILNNGAVELYYDDTATVVTTATGLTFGTSGELKHDGTTLDIVNYSNGDAIQMISDNNAGTPTTVFKGDPDNSVDLYYAGTKAAETDAAGFNIYDTSGDDPYLDFFASTGVVQGQIGFYDGGTFQIYDSISTNNIIKSNPNTSVELYYAGTKALVTSVEGLEIYDSSARQFLIGISATGTYLSNVVAGQPVYLRSLNAAGAVQNVLFKADPDGAAELYHAGVLSASTSIEGFSIYDTSGDDVILSFRDDAAARQGYVAFQNGGDFIVRDDVNDDTMLTGTANGAVDLYYDGTKSVSTSFTGGYYGIELGAGAAQATIVHNGTFLLNRNLVNGSVSYVQGSSATPADKDMAVFDPDGAVELYYDGTKTFETESDGVRIWGTGADYTDLQITASGTFQVLNKNAGSAVALTGRNVADAADNNLLVADPDTAVDLYYAGVQTFATTAAGISITDGTATAATIGFSSDDLVIDSNDPGGQILFKGQTAGNSPVDLMTLNPDAASLLYRGGLTTASFDTAVTLYYSGGKRFTTNTAGASIYGSAGTEELRFAEASDDWYIQNITAAGSVYIAGGAGATTLAGFDPAGAAELYYAGVKTLATTTTGTAGFNWGDLDGGANGDWVQNYVSAGVTYTISKGTSYPFELRANNSANAEKQLFVGDPDGAANLYYAGSAVLKTAADGISIQDTSGDDTYLVFSDSAAAQQGYMGFYNAGTFIVYDDVTDANIMTSTPAGAVKLYYGGSERIATTVTGSSFIGSIVPGSDSSYNLGSGSLCWATVYGDAGVTSCSDPKYKKDVQQETLGLGFINDLVPVAFKFKKTGKRPKKHDRVYHGLMATDVEAALQEAGLEYEDFGGLEATLDEDGERWLGLKYEQFIAPMIKAIQELTDKVSQLEKGK